MITIKDLLKEENKIRQKRYKHLAIKQNIFNEFRKLKEENKTKSDNAFLEITNKCFKLVDKMKKEKETKEEDLKNILENDLIDFEEREKRKNTITIIK